MGFFDELSKKASETYKNTAEKTNKLAREMKLKSLMNEDKDKIEEIYIEIGKKVYEKHIREENIDIKSELADECSKIDAYAKEIEDTRMEILSLKNLRLCKKCAAEISITAKFCPKCGATQEEERASDNVVTEIMVKENGVVEVANNGEMESNIEHGNNMGQENNMQPANNIEQRNNSEYDGNNIEQGNNVVQENKDIDQNFAQSQNDGF